MRSDVVHVEEISESEQLRYTLCTPDADLNADRCLNAVRFHLVDGNWRSTAQSFGVTVSGQLSGDAAIADAMARVRALMKRGAVEELSPPARWRYAPGAMS